MEYGDNCRDLKEVLSQSDPSFDPTCGYLMSLLYTSLYFSNILQYIAYITASKVRHASQYKLYCIRAHLMQAWVPSFFSDAYSFIFYLSCQGTLSRKTWCSVCLFCASCCSCLHETSPSSKACLTWYTFRLMLSCWEIYSAWCPMDLRCKHFVSAAIPLGYLWLAAFIAFILLKGATVASRMSRTM